MTSRARRGVVRALLDLRGRGRSLRLVEQRTDPAPRVCDRAYVLSGAEIVLEDRADPVNLEERPLINAHLG